MSGSEIAQFLVILPVLLLSLAAHELAHASVATALGDPTPRAMGRMTFNPLAHLDPFGTIVLVVSYFLPGGVMFGWAKPVQFDPRHLPRRGESLVAVAGPFTNFVLALLCGVAVALLDSVSLTAADLFWRAYVLNMTLAILNILPIPPLDGWRTITGLLPLRAREVTDRFLPYESYIFIVFFLVLWRFPGFFASIFLPPMRAVASLLGFAV